MLRHSFPILAAVLLGLSALTASAQSSPDTQSLAVTELAPAGCTTSMEWVQEGNHYYYGRGKVQCSTGRYKVKLLCRNQQTGEAYVVYGSSAVNAPSTATTTCYTGNVAEGVFAVEDPRPAGVSGCATWREWINDGYNYYFGRGSVQCESGRYQVKLSCRNVQTGYTYVNYSSATYAPSVATTTCYVGNVADAVEVVPL